MAGRDRPRAEVGLNAILMAPAAWPAHLTDRSFVVVGATLSRWTMSYFAAALVSLIGAESLMAVGYGFPAAPLAAPETLLMVHLIAIGWLSLLMLGALFQFVPVLVARPLYSETLPLPSLLLLLAGLSALLLGFLQLAGTLPAPPSLLPIAAVLLAGGFGLSLWTLARTLWTARPLPLPARFVAVGLAGVSATVVFGVIFAFVLGGLATTDPFLDAVRIGVPIHVIAGLGGWLTFTAMGVSYRLMAMFMLAPELDGSGPRGVFYAGAMALAVAVLGGCFAIHSGASLAWVFGVAAPLTLAALILYGRDILYLYRARKRRVIELNARMAAVAFVNLAAIVALAMALLAVGQFGRHVGALVFLIGLSWLSGLGLAKLYKIAAFLTWLECYGPVLGKMPTPRVQDLVVERRAVPWFVLYHAAVWSAGLCLFAEAPLAFRAAAAVMLAATVGISAELVRIRRLSDVTAAHRLQILRRPSLLLSPAQHT